MAAKKRPIRERKAIMIRPDPDLLEAMESAAAHEGISLNKLALEIIETSGRLGAKEAAGSRAEVEATVLEIEKEFCPTIKRGKGCERCGNTGYRGRVGLYELLMMSDAIRHHIASGADANIIREQAITEGMRTLRLDALEKLKAGITTPEEVVRVTRAL